MSSDLRAYLPSRGIATSRTTPYRPQANGQTERYNGTIWKAVQLGLHSRKLDETHWEIVLPDALHSIRSLLSVATNCTPHERLFSYERRTKNGSALPTWLMEPGTVLLRRHVRNKTDPLVDEVDLLEANPRYAYVRFQNGREDTVSIKDLAPVATPSTLTQDNEAEPTVSIDKPDPTEEQKMENDRAEIAPRRSERERRQPDRYVPKF